MAVHSEATKGHEYKTGGLPDTVKYSVDKKQKSQPSVSTPSDKKEDPDAKASSQKNYGF